MINLKYELKKEEFEEEEIIEIEIIEITAETDSPSTRIRFEKDDELLAETFTNNDGTAICGFTPTGKRTIVKAIVNEEEEKITIPKNPK